jgi:hypothetical protein
MAARGIVDSGLAERENGRVLRPGDSRRRLTQRLNAAYADGLLSEETFDGRLNAALGPGIVDPRRLVGDLSVRSPGHWHRRLIASLTSEPRRRASDRPLRHDDECQLLALDWTGATAELVIGRHRSCDVVLASDDVSRRHARMVFRDGAWILHDLDSTNGTLVNGVRVGRYRLRAGDRIRLGTQDLRID